MLNKFSDTFVDKSLRKGLYVSANLATFWGDSTNNLLFDKICIDKMCATTLWVLEPSPIILKTYKCLKHSILLTFNAD